MRGRKTRYVLADTAQQTVGGFILGGPFVMAEEIWNMAENVSSLHLAATVLIVLGIGYTALYEADEERDPDTEKSFLGIPLRFISLVAVSYLSVGIIAVVVSAPQTFGADVTTGVKAVMISTIFSVVGAATADTVFR
ncbi:MAG: DUF2391 domain-containing protein [Halobacteria archaeon]|nr:DUF2391 domain-containing protein [Halobacteria archaeon]